MTGATPSGATSIRMSLGITALAVALRAPTFVRRFYDPDEAAIGVQAMVVRAGGTLYRDIYDRKPPLPPLAYAASFSVTDSTDIRPLRVLVTVLLAACGVLVGRECTRRHGSVAGWWGGVLLVAGAMALFPADSGAANYAHFALLPGAAAIIWSRRGTLGGAVAGGVALGLAILTRQSWLLGVLPGCISVGLSGRWRNVGPFLIAAAATVATTAFYAPFGQFWEWNVTNSPGFVFAGAGIWSSIGRGLASLGGFVMFHPVIVAAAIISGVGLVTAARRRRLPDDIDLWVWMATGVAAWAAGLRFFGHYWLQLIPPMVLLAAPIVARWTKHLRAIAIAGIAVPAAVTFGLLWVPGSFHDRPDPSALATYVRSHSASGDRVFVWGSYPELLVAAGRLPGGALVHTDFVVGRSGGRTDPAITLRNAVPGAAGIMLRSLTDHPPELILDTSPSPDLGYRNYPTSLVPELDRLIHERYRRLAVVDDVVVWQRLV